MLCDLCGEMFGGEEEVCPSCTQQLKTHIGMKCLDCESMGFIPKTPENLARVAFFLGEQSIEAMMSMPVIVPTRSCPSCLMEGNVLREGMMC